MTEIDRKIEVLRKLMVERNLDALLLRRVSSFAWATSGAASYINTAVTDGDSSVLITPEGRYVITNNIESPRLEQEEKLGEQGWELRVGPWYDPPDTVAELTRGMKLGADGPYPDALNLAAEMARIRANLLPEEIDRFRDLGRICAESMDVAIRSIQPGMTEYEIAGVLGQEAQSRGAGPIVNLIAVDDRIFSFRHPLPTDKKMERYAMLVLCGRKRGLVCSITRLVHFGSLPEEIRLKTDAVAQIDAQFIVSTRPGRDLGEIFEQVENSYTAVGYPDEWQLHHQGGPAGYEAREYVAVPGSTDVVVLGQTYAWNPSITGTKSEDTILIGESGNEVLTEIPGWPMLSVTIEGQSTSISRPDILIV